MASITIHGVDELQRKLGKAAANTTLRQPMHRAVLRLQRDMANYDNAIRPEPTPYVRTGRLGRSWTTKVTANASGVTGKVGNNTVYAPWVQSERFQARMHRGIWQTDQDVIDRNRDNIIRDFQQAIDRALEGK